MKGHIVVGGGTGFIGSYLCRYLKNHGYDYTIISRMPGPKRMTWHELQEIGLPDSTTAVVNLAGQNVLDMTKRWTEGYKQNVWNSRINTTNALAKAIANFPKDSIKSFVTMSGVGIYPPDKTKAFTEQSPINEFDFFSKLCIEWEAAGRVPSHKACHKVTIRSGVVLGRQGGMIKQLYWPFYFGLGGPVMPGNQLLPWIHIADLVQLINNSIEKHYSGIFNGVAPQQITNKEFSTAFAKALFRPAIFPVPEFVFNILLGKERAIMLTTGPRVVPARASEVGFKYLYPDIQSACNEVVAEAVANP